MKRKCFLGISGKQGLRKNLEFILNVSGDLLFVVQYQSSAKLVFLKTLK